MEPDVTFLICHTGKSRNSKTGSKSKMTSEPPWVTFVKDITKKCTGTQYSIRLTELLRTDEVMAIQGKKHREKFTPALARCGPHLSKITSVLLDVWLSALQVGHVPRKVGSFRCLYDIVECLAAAVDLPAQAKGMPAENDAVPM